MKCRECHQPDSLFLPRLADLTRNGPDLAVTPLHGFLWCYPQVRRHKGVCMEQVLGIGGVFFKAHNPEASRRLVSRTPGRARRTRAHLRGFHLCRGWRAGDLVCVPCGHFLLRFGAGTVHGQLSRPEPRRHVGPTPSCRSAGRRPSRGLRLWPVRLGDRPGRQPIRAMGATPTRKGVSAPRRTNG